MKYRRTKALTPLRAIALSLFGGLAFSAAAVAAEPVLDAPEAGSQKRWEVVIGPYAYHWSESEAHQHVYLAGLERKDEDGHLAGLSLFRNSFGQPSAYAYYGKAWEHILDNTHLYLKLSGGVIYGYKGEYAHKVPFNHHGFGLAVIPAAGWRFDASNAVQVAMLGSAALIFTYNRGF